MNNIEKIIDLFIEEFYNRIDEDHSEDKRLEILTRLLAEVFSKLMDAFTLMDLKYGLEGDY